MPKHKKKFIDKKHAVSFHLVHRSQRDPLQADEGASRTVLVPSDASKPGNESTKSEEHRAQLLEAGIFYDDDYDYMQHLRSRDQMNEVGPGIERFVVEAKPTVPKFRLPAEVLPSQEENDVGMLNMAQAVTGPQPDWDPDIIEALDGNFDDDDPDNVLEDDFVIRANGPADGLEYNISEDNDMLADRRKQAWIHEHLFSSASATAACEPGLDEDEWEDVDEDEDGSDAHNDSDACEGTLSDDDETTHDDLDDGCHGDAFAQEETKSRFTNYSMSSSVLPRTKGLQLLDERFEQVFAQYDDTEIGALDHEDISGRLPVSSAVLESTLAEFLHSRQPVDKAQLIQKRETAGDRLQEEDGSCDSPDESADEDSSEDDESDEEGHDDEKLVRVAMQAPNAEKWDCESILSTYSSLYNHPKLLEEPRKPKDLAKALLSRPKPTRADSPPKAAGRSERGIDVPNQRPTQGETAEERRARKQLVKLDRKKRREEKKATKDAFKHEKLRQEKEIINLRQNLQGVRIV